MIKRDFLRHFKGSFIQRPRQEMGKILLFAWRSAWMSTAENLLKSVQLSSGNLLEHQLHDMHFARFTLKKKKKKRIRCSFKSSLWLFEEFGKIGHKNKGWQQFVTEAIFIPWRNFNFSVAIPSFQVFYKQHYAAKVCPSDLQKSENDHYF